MIYSEYKLGTGIFTGKVWSGPEEWKSMNTADGCGFVAGVHDGQRCKFAEAAGVVVPYQPPAPDADEWTEWAWDADLWEWVSSPTDAALARDARAERDKRLQACDWTQLSDVPAATTQAWEGYRQALRNITQQAGFPASIDWPVAPT